MLPEVETDASGIASFMLNESRDTISINASFVGTSVTSAAIYIGSEVNNGEVLFDLTNDLLGNRITTFITGSELEENLAELLKGNIYLQAASDIHPTGELRGQVHLAAEYNFVAELNSEEVIPSITSNAYGLGSFELTFDKERLNFRIICQNMSGSINDAKLHIGDIGIVGNEIEDVSTFIDGNTIFGSIEASAELLNNIFNEEVYINVSTADFPDGEIRAQLKLNKGLSFEVFADGQQMVPIENSPAKGIAVFRLSPTLDSLYYNIVATNIASSLNYCHFHIGAAGEAYGGLQLDFSNTINGNSSKGFLTGGQISNTAIKHLLLGELALIFHTNAFPNGQIRGQTIKFAHEGYTIQIDGLQEVPVVITAAYGTGVLSINRDRSCAYYNWLAGDLSSEATAAQLMHAPVGSVGPVIFDMTDMMQASGTQAKAKGAWKTTTAEPFSDFNADLIAENSVYLNINTTNNVDGEIRGQILSGTVFYTTTVIVNVFKEEEFLFSISPNPSKELITVKTDEFSKSEITVTIYDMMGREILNKLIESNTNTVNVNIGELKKGTYLIQLKDGKGNQVSKKLIKQ